MDTEKMCKDLPCRAPDGLLDYTLRKHLYQLGANRTVYKRVSATVAPDLLKQIITPEDIEEYETRKRNLWAAECCCTVCGQNYYTNWVKDGKFTGIGLIEGDDGMMYTTLGDFDPSMGRYVELSDGDGFLCPYCSTVTHLKHRSALRNGRTWRILMTSVDNIGIYTAVIYWLVARTIDEYGITHEKITPWQAYVLDEKVRLRRFIFNDYTGKWRYSRSNTDAFFSQYPTMDGNLYNYGLGGYCYEKLPSLLGCTGEKTGLYAYISHGGQTPVLYLKTWRQYRNLENLINAGWVDVVQDWFKEETKDYVEEIPYAKLRGIDLEKKRPHEMLHMDKASFRQLQVHYPNGWCKLQCEKWLQYHMKSGGNATAVVFDSYYNWFGLPGVNALLEMRKIDRRIDFHKLDKYLEKQKLRRKDATMLLDTWKMTIRLHGRQELTTEDLWPRDLFAAHERLARLNRLEQSKEDWSKYLEGFLAVRKRYKDLEWTDGELCVVLPKDNGDLIREGDILWHCVGAYGPDHVAGNHTIFFIRKYRRPERSYYTLDINMTGRPVRQQLHGYGNERHGPNKEYSHSIPKKVQDFCSRWEKEILMPWHREQQREQARNNANKVQEERKSA